MKKIYKGNQRKEISFPLGGIGSGCIGLDGTGRFRDWEIFNRPSKGSLNGFSHFGIKAEREGKTVSARVMNSDWLDSHMGRYVQQSIYGGYGFGPVRELLCGVPHFRDCEFSGEFPLAEIQFIDDTFPGSVKLEAFNPFIPSNDKDSSIPAAFFTAEVTNTGDAPMTYTFELSVNNPSKKRHVNRLAVGKKFHGIELTDDFADDTHQDYGSIVFGVPVGDDLQVQQYWYRGGWFDNLGVFWQDFTAPGKFKNRVYEGVAGEGCVSDDIATIAVCREVAPGETYRQRFLIGWFYPNCINYWTECSESDPDYEFNTSTWKNYYAVLFGDVYSMADYALGEWDRLEADTRKFHDALFESDLPDAAMDAVSANLSVLKSATVLRLPDGQVYGFEGCQTNSGCCEGSCTHVWNYTHALPFLFPNLERSMRELDYTYNQREDGGMSFRLQLPLGRKRWNFRPCVDGQMGGVIKTYREWKLCGDDEWLRKLWPMVRKSIEYAWAPTNEDRWDTERSGIITGRQHHTLDMELFGPNAWLNTFYIGALTAAAEMADVMGEPENAELFRELAAKSRQFTDNELFNGEYYSQKVDIYDKSILAPYEDGDTLIGESTVDAYWNEEAGQLKYQIVDGCDIDQVLAQWMCELAGIGDVLDHDKVTSALSSIYRYNFKSNLRDHFNPCRIYGLNDEASLLICNWPEDKAKPAIPIPYAEESQHGYEYQAAIHMIMHGLEKEGMDVVRGIRDRYDGEKRNPWNEIECGSNYARSMASYALLLAYSGFKFDMRRNRMGMQPIHPGSYFWSVDGGWGVCACGEDGVKMDVRYGELVLKEWVVPDADKVKGVSVDGVEVSFTAADGALNFSAKTVLKEGMMIEAIY